MRRHLENISILTIVSFSFVFAFVVLTAAGLGAFDNDEATNAVPVAQQPSTGGDGVQTAADFQKEFSQAKAALFAPQTVFIKVGGNTQRVTFRITSSASDDQEVASDSSPAVTLLQNVSPANESVPTTDESAPVSPADNQSVVEANVPNTTTTTTTNAPASNSGTMPESVRGAPPESNFDYTGLSLNQLNWCYPGQPWGNGVCSDPGLTPFKEERWWTCGWYWAHWDLGFIPLSDVPLWCGVDSDGDGVPDYNDSCPQNPNKTDRGLCGCDELDTDTDSDGTPDCNDRCDTDSAKIFPGLCGCGTPDTDTDGDGTPDCNDSCPTDSGKVFPGICGCGTPDTDTDTDGTPDCDDGCPFNINKILPGVCGCDEPDFDTDGDGTLDCDDGCPGDFYKTDPGFCGCYVPETDTDGDGTPDCIDYCPNDPDKIAPGQCGCGIDDSWYPFCWLAP